MEEVLGFQAYIEEWSAPLTSAGYSIRAFRMEASDWVEWPRTRMLVPLSFLRIIKWFCKHGLVAE